jgi:hypothetical protein
MHNMDKRQRYQCAIVRDRSQQFIRHRRVKIILVDWQVSRTSSQQSSSLPLAKSSISAQVSSRKGGATTTDQNLGALVEATRGDGSQDALTI